MEKKELLEKYERMPRDELMKELMAWELKYQEKEDEISDKWKEIHREDRRKFNVEKCDLMDSIQSDIYGIRDTLIEEIDGKRDFTLEDIPQLLYAAKFLKERSHSFWNSDFFEGDKVYCDLSELRKFKFEYEDAKRKLENFVNENLMELEE